MSQPLYQKGGDPKLSPLTALPPPTLQKRKCEHLELLSELPPQKKISNPFLSLLLAAESQLPSAPSAPRPTMLKWKMQSSGLSCASGPLPAPKPGASSKTTSATPRSSWASLTASEKQAMHQKMLEGRGYSLESIKYGSALPPHRLSQFTLHHSRHEPYQQLTVLPQQFNAVNPSLVAPTGIGARGEEHLLYQEFRELFLRSLSHCLYQRHLELTLHPHSASTTIVAPTSSTASSPLMVATNNKPDSSV